MSVRNPMSRPLKRFLLFALTGILFLTAVALLVRFVLMVSFERLEQDATQQSLRQVERALGQAVKHPGGQIEQASLAAPDKPPGG